MAKRQKADKPWTVKAKFIVTRDVYLTAPDEDEARRKFESGEWDAESGDLDCSDYDFLSIEPNN
jgi:hypothetical protein